MSSKSLSQVLLAAATVAAVAVGRSISLPPGDDSRTSKNTPPATAAPVPVLKVYVSGAVRSPGVFTVREGDRLSDVIAVAGGADRDAEASPALPHP